MLEIYAGKTALKTLQQEGFKQELFSSFLGASGGPKWFALYGLDKYVFGQFFQNRQTELNLIGSSAGAFRAACFAQKDPVASITRMAESYSETVYSKSAKPEEITRKAIELLDYVLGENGVEEIIQNKIYKTHFLVNKMNGFVASDNNITLLLGLIKSTVRNRIDRKLLRDQYERYVFKSPSSNLKFYDYCDFQTEYIDLTTANLKSALLASGSIPMVMQGIKDIPGAPDGMYRDGGIVDYHFDIKIEDNNGLILYPHFSPVPKAGWFDKNLKRKVLTENYDKIVMLVPSASFVKSLPYSKIPDRTDFTKMEPDQRIKYWKTVLVETQRVGDSFGDFLASGDINKIQTFG